MNSARFTARHFEPFVRIPPKPSGFHFVDQPTNPLPEIKIRLPLKRRTQRVPFLQIAIASGVLLFLPSSALYLNGGVNPKSPAYQPMSLGLSPAKPVKLTNPSEHDIVLVAYAVEVCQDDKVEAAVELGTTEAQQAPQDSRSYTVQLVKLGSE